MTGQVGETDNSRAAHIRRCRGCENVPWLAMWRMVRAVPLIIRGVKEVHAFPEEGESPPNRASYGAAVELILV